MHLVAPRRRSFGSMLLGVLAMCGSLAVLGAFVVSDVAAAADTPPAQAQQQQAAGVEAPAKPKTEKPEKRRAVRKKAKVDFGRFESY